MTAKQAKNVKCFLRLWYVMNAVLVSGFKSCFKNGMPKMFSTEKIYSVFSMLDHQSNPI